MDQRRRAVVLAASGAIIASASVLLLDRDGHGLHADFWRGFSIGLALVLIAAAVVLLMRARRLGRP
jgi:hypothetical protein